MVGLIGDYVNDTLFGHAEAQAAINAALKNAMNQALHSGPSGWDVLGDVKALVASGVGTVFAGESGAPEWGDIYFGDQLADDVDDSSAGKDAARTTGTPTHQTARCQLQRLRQIELDDRTVAALRAHRTMQRRERLASGDPQSSNDFVFTRPDGRSLHPKLVSQQFRRLVRRHELSAMSVHGLRHTWATLALQAGIHPKVVQERLGHAL